MKKSFLLIVFALIFVFGGCMINVAIPELTTLTSDTEPFASDDVSLTVEEQSTLFLEATTDNIFESTDFFETSTDEEITTEEVSSEEVSATAENSSDNEKTTRNEPTTQKQSITQVDLSIEMPEQNGTMQTDSSSDNKFIAIVKNERKIKTDLLVAVFSLPDTGQNYVFEFRDEKGRSADDIRRVYLIDKKGNITSVAAADAKEKENISSIENWFCMNVLIKEVIYPAIEGSIK